MYAAIFIAVIVFFVMFHEFGHFVTAKAFGMKADRFFLGFGPTLWSFRRGETEYGVKAIPAGGFVRIVGMNKFEDVDPADRGRTFHSRPAWQRAVVLASGSATHFVVAFALLVAAFSLVGVPILSNAVDRVVGGDPAARAGLRPGDRIVAVDGRRTPDFDAVRATVTARGGEMVPVTVLRDGRRLTVEVGLAERDPEGSPGGYLGVAPRVVTRTLPFGEALGATVSGDLSLVRITQVSLSGLAQALSPSQLSSWFSSVDDPGPRSPEGPISLVGAGQLVSALGASGDVFAVLVLLVNLNVVLGVLNMLPLPPLDGGHLAVLLVEQGVNRVRRVRGRPSDWQLDPAVLTPIALAVVLFFGTVFLTSLYLDITKPASGLLP
ncbi:MAG: site-2 protease family protein [Actinomycetota bacterium]|nr:site-2 protease family protein [Actinomycetota bacterium]